MKNDGKTKNRSIEELESTRRKVKKLETLLKKCEHAERDITERKRAEERIEHLNAVLTAIRNVNQIIVRERDPEKLIKRACEVLTKTRGYFTAWIALLGDSDKFSHIASSGFNGTFKPLEERIRSGRLGKCALALREQGVHVVHDPSEECHGCPAAATYKRQSAVAIQLQHGGQRQGLMVLSMDARMVDDAEEQHLIAEVADDIAYSLQNLETEKKRIEAEKSQIETLARYRTLFEQSQDAILVSTPEGTIEDANSAGAAIFGLTPETVRSQRAADLYVNPADRQAVVQELKLHGSIRNHAVTYRRADGSTFDALINTQIIPAPEGTGVQYLTTVRDITEVKRAQDELRESEGRLSAVFKSSPVGISVTRLADDQYVDVNDAFLRLFGYTREQALSQTSLQLRTWANPNDRAKVVNVLRENRSVQNYEAPFLKTTGEVWTGLFSAELIDFAGEQHILVLLQDVTKRREERKALQASEERYRTTMMSVGDGVITTDTEGRLELLNPVAEALTGWRQAEARAKPVEEVFRIINEESRQTVENPVRRVMREGVVVGLANHSVLIAKDGTEHPIADSGAPIRNEKGEITGVVLVFRDQTKERAAEKALRENEESFEALAGNANDGILVAAGKGIHVFANKRAEEITGYSVDELAKISIKDLAHPDEFNERINERYKKILAGEPVPKQYETIIVRKDGKNVPVEVSSAKTNWFGQAADLVIIRDITERKLAEEALRISEARFSAVFQANPIGLSITRLADGQYVDVNDAFLSLFGYTREEALSHTSIQLQTWASSEERDRVVKILRDKGHLRDIEAQYCRKSGEIFTALVSAEMIDVGGERYSLSILQNVTERKQANEALEKQNVYIKMILDNFPIGIATNEIDSMKVTYMNRKFSEIYGWPEDEFPNVGIFFEKVFPDMEYRQQMQTKILADISSGAIKRMNWDDLKITTKAGDRRVVYASNIPLINQNIMVSTVQDITERKRTEEALRESERKFRETVTYLDEGYYHCTMEGVLLEHNNAFNRILGFEIERDLRGEKLPDFWQNPNERKQYLDEFAAKGFVRNYLINAKKSDGEKITVMANAHMTKDVTGRPVGIEGTFIDITDRVRMEEALRVSEERSRIVTESITDVIYEWDLKESITWFGDVDGLLGYPVGIFPRTLDGWAAVLHPEDKERVWMAVEEQLKGAAPYDVEYRIQGNDGAWYWWSARGTVIKNEQGEPSRWIGAVTDVTERKQAEEALKISKERLLFATEGANLGIWNWNTVTGELIWSNQCKALFGIPRDETMTYQRFSDALHPEDRERTDKAVKDALDNHKDYNIEYRSLWPDESVHWLEAKGRGYYDATGNAERLEGVVLDITERKLAEEEIRKLNAELEDRVVKRTAQLEASNKELEAFTYSVSHDLRAPLRHTSGYVELLARRFQSDLPEKGQHYLKSIADSVRQMGTLIDDLLQFSRTGRMEMRRRDIDMNGIVQEVVESLRKDNPHRTIEWALGALPSVSGDDAMLRLVWLNLLSNAVKFTRTRKKARIEIGVRKENKEFVFFVRDDGVGFDMQYAQKLFGVFQRLHPLEEFEGTGIGLANVSRIILRHGGRTWAEAELDKGATFFFSIPNQ